MAREPKNTGRKSDGTFAAGNSLGGKPKGARHKATIAAEALLDGEAEGLTRKAIDLALAGDTIALRLCLERLVPPRKDRPVLFALPPIAGAADHPTVLVAVIDAVAAGEITPAEAQALAGILSEHRKAIEVAEIETRLAALEARAEERR